MPNEASASMSSDAFNECKRAGHKFGARSTECHVPMNDAKLDVVFNPHGKDGGTPTTDQYPHPSGNYGRE